MTGRGVRGSLEAVVDGRAVGWAWDPAAPERAVEVEVLVDERPVAAGRADIDRPSLAAAGIGDGRHAFDVSLPARLADEPIHTIRVTAGPERAEVPAFHRFETVVRMAPWHATRFVPGGRNRIALEREPQADTVEAALVGRHGWLFARDDRHLTAEHLHGAPLLPPAEIERRRDAVARRRRLLRDLRIGYLFAIAPLKERVYGRFLPRGAALAGERPVTQVDRALRDVAGGEVLDLLPALRQARRAGHAFPKTDSGWSERGAFFAYRALMREAGKRVVDLRDPLPLDAPLVTRAGFRGDLADRPKVRLTEDGFVAARGDAPERWVEDIEVADVSRLRSLRMPAPMHLEVTPGHAPRLYELADEPKLPHAVLVGDGACLRLIPWLAEHFRRLVFLRARELPLEAIELEMPDLVIHVVSERRLLDGP